MGKASRDTQVIPALSEDQVQFSVVELLELYENGGDLFFFHVVNQLPRPKILYKLINKAAINQIYAAIAKKLSRLGKKAGIPDLFIFVPYPEGNRHVLLAWECKTRTGKLSDAQESVRDKLVACGVVYSVIRSVEDARQALEGWV